LWNSNVLISDTGQILIHHRKLVATFFEKLVWDPGDGAGLVVANTRIGRIGGLICGEVQIRSRATV
jgi:aliphatic nitrilase